MVAILECTYVPLAVPKGEEAAVGDGDADPKSSSQLLYRYPDRPTEKYSKTKTGDRWMG